jgi:glycosyltransferase involved in cell wall biosynthesis
MVDSSPLVSIIIPTCDGERFVQAAVESALSQTYEKTEIIVVDDGSRDRTVEIVSSMQDPRLQLILLPQPSGHAARPRNIGAAASSGSLIAPLDHDDLAHPERIARQVERFESDPRLVLLGTQGVRIDAEGKEVAPWPMPTGEARVVKALRWTCPFIHSATMFRRDAFEAAGGYDERPVLAQDHALWLRLAGVGNVDNLPDVLCSYRIHPTQITQNRLMSRDDKAAIAEARLAMAQGRGESIQMAALRQRLWVWRHAFRAFRRVLRS